MTLIEGGIPAPELVSIEAYLRRHRDEYFGALRTTLGPTYDPENHPVAEWLDYYTGVALDRLALRDAIVDALPADLGTIAAALIDAGDPPDWATLLLAARTSRLTTARAASMTGRSEPAARAQLAQIAARGWLTPQGRTRGRWHASSSRLDALDLLVPGLLELLASGDVAS